MMAQYQLMRRSLPDDVLLFFRLGDFYEMFFEDAKQAAGLLNVALTKRGGVPMCGVPHHAAENYIAKLIKDSSQATKSLLWGAFGAPEGGFGGGGPVFDQFGIVFAHS